MANRVPMLRIGQQDLKCRRGCGFYGNTQFDGLCSKCFRELNDKQRKQLKLSEDIDAISNVASSYDGTMERKSPHQSLSLLRPKSKKQPEQEAAPSESQVASTLPKKKFTVPSMLQKTLKNKFPISEPQPRLPTATESQFMLQLHQMRLPDEAKRKLKIEIQRLDHEIRKYMNHNNKNIDELSDLVQNAYTRFADMVHNDVRFDIVVTEERENVIDFFEKVVMTQNHNFLFSPYFTTDEECDVKVQKRIRQLSWITTKHLDCNIDEVNAAVRDLVYNAISELVGIDSYYSPQEKLNCTVRCCRHIFELLKCATGRPASADDFMPALVFVVLKANPVRLHSNINFVNRFTNASRVMSGEGGYHFTSLCLAISFIEKLNGASLNMSEGKYKSLMSGEQTFSTPWESALLACESFHLLSENMKCMEQLLKRISVISTTITDFEQELGKFKRGLCEKVGAVITKAPLTMLPIKTPSHLINRARVHLTLNNVEAAAGYYQSNLLSSDISQKALTVKKKSLMPEDMVGRLSSPLHQNNAPQDQLFPSPIINCTPFDAISLLDEYSENGDVPMLDIEFQRGLTNINYDFDLSEQSGEISIDDSKFNLDEFDPLVQRSALNPLQTEAEFNQLDTTTDSLIDTEVPASGVLLPSPLKPEVTNYRGFSNFDIQTISCNTGHLSSLHMELNPPTASVKTD